MGTSLAFHIVFAALGVGVPFLAFVAEGLGLFTNERTWYQLARRWDKAFATCYAIGAVSGTILSFELGLRWPTFMKFSEAVSGLPFALESFAFFIEAIFLGTYLSLRLGSFAAGLASAQLSAALESRAPINRQASSTESHESRSSAGSRGRAAMSKRTGAGGPRVAWSMRDWSMRDWKNRAT